MSANTKIEWCDSTLNPVIGCTKIAPACDNCYAAQQDKFRHWTPEGWGGPRKRTSEATWKQPIKWNAQPFFECSACGWRGAPKVRLCPACQEISLRPARRRVFCASLADVFDNQWDPQWRRDLFDLIELTPSLDWLLLTKRIGNVVDMVRVAKHGTWLADQKNVWLGATVASQDEADRDIPKLLAVPAHKRFLSMEPLLEPVDLKLMQCCGALVDGHLGSFMQPPDGPECCGSFEPIGLDWVIAGGESGPLARPSHPDWFRSLRDQCAAAGVPFLFKQWGEWLPTQDAKARALKDTAIFSTAGVGMRRVGKKAAGRVLDGVEHNGFPA